MTIISGPLRRVDVDNMETGLSHFERPDESWGSRRWYKCRFCERYFDAESLIMEHYDWCPIVLMAEAAGD